MTLEIPNELGVEIERAAHRRGTDVTAFVIEAARRAMEELPHQLTLKRGGARWQQGWECSPGAGRAWTNF